MTGECGDVYSLLEAVDVEQQKNEESSKKDVVGVGVETVRLPKHASPCQPSLLP